MKLTYFGHSAFLIQSENFNGLIDPFLTGNSHTTITPEDLESITHIFITHGHGDHIGDAMAIAKKFNPLIICNYEISNYLSQKGFKTHPLQIGGKRKFDFGVVKMTPALHGSGIEEGDKIIEGGLAGGFIIEIKGKKIYHAGDTGLSMEMKLLEREKIDIALLPIGGNFTMDIEDAVLAVDFIKPKKVIPIHYKTFEVINVEPEEFKKRAENVEVEILPPGRTIEV